MKIETLLTGKEREELSKFRKKPVVIEAERFTWKIAPWPEGVVWDVKVQAHVIPTLEGNMIVSEGDWIITGVAGERYPCKDHIFAQTYEAVD